MYRTGTKLLDIFVRSALALLASALILFAVFALFVSRDSSTPAVPLQIPGKDLNAMVGTAEVAGDALAVTGYESRDGEQVAVAAWRGSVRAQDYPLLRYQVDVEFPGPTLNLIWRTADEPAALKSIELPRGLDEPVWLDLSRNEKWRGTVVELGVYAYTSDAGDTLVIRQLTLEPAGWRGELASYWAELATFRGWTSRTINQIYGTVDTTVLSPVLVAAAWSALAVLLLLVSGWVGAPAPAAAFAAAVLLPWLALDLLWQRELAAQLVQTREHFAGKTVEEKHLADVDRHIYRYIMRLKQDVLPEKPARILLLHDSSSHNFARLKAQYYLLPHNVYNFGRIPPAYGLETFDYVLLLGETPRVSFDADAHALRWKHGKRALGVELLDDDFMGRLYRVTPRPGNAGDAQ